MREVYVDGVVIQTVDVGLNGIVIRSKAGVGAIGGQNLVVANSRQDVIEAAEAVATVHQIVLNRLTRKRIKVRFVNVFLTGSDDAKGGSNAATEQGLGDVLLNVEGNHNFKFLITHY